MTPVRKNAVKPIHDAKDHVAAKKAIEELMIELSEGNSDVADDIEVLVALVEAYERRSFPVHVPSATEAIRFRMDQLGLTQRDLVPYIGSTARISDVMNGSRNLSTDMMRALHEGLGIPYEALMKRSSPSDGDQIDVKVPVLNKLKSIGLNIEKAQVTSFLTKAFGGQITPALNRKTRTPRASGKTDYSSLLMWQAAVLTKARSKAVASFSHDHLSEDFLRSLVKLSLRKDGPRKAIETLKEIGIVVVVVPVLPGTFLDGAAMLLDGKIPVIGLTLRHDRVDNFWFTLIHEACHHYLHFDVLKSSGHAFFDEFDLKSEDRQELQADQMTLKTLIPEDCVANIRDPYASTEDIKSAARCAGVHVSIAAGRWQKKHDNYKKFSRLIRRNTLREQLLS